MHQWEHQYFERGLWIYLQQVSDRAFRQSLAPFLLRDVLMPCQHNHTRENREDFYLLYPRVMTLLDWRYLLSLRIPFLRIQVVAQTDLLIWVFQECRQFVLSAYLDYRNFIDTAKLFQNCKKNNVHILYVYFFYVLSVVSSRSSIALPCPHLYNSMMIWWNWLACGTGLFLEYFTTHYIGQWRYSFSGNAYRSKSSLQRFPSIPGYLPISYCYSLCTRDDMSQRMYICWYSCGWCKDYFCYPRRYTIHWKCSHYSGYTGHSRPKDTYPYTRDRGTTEWSRYDKNWYSFRQYFL